jgi:hypothetical protein
MLNKLMDDRDLYRMVDETLHYVWDPIGVAGEARARDEYYGYVPATFKLLREGAAAEAIGAYLDDVTVDGMGLSPNPQHTLKAARLLTEWREIVRMSPSTLRSRLPPMPEYTD